MAARSLDEAVSLFLDNACPDHWGSKGWEPLSYLCFTRVPLRSVTENAVAIARALLDRGANPNVHFMAGDSRYTPLTGAIGEGEEGRPAHQQRDALVRLLLERGANPYNQQVTYNIHFNGEVLWSLELIYEHSLRTGRAADWATTVGIRRVRGVRGVGLARAGWNGEIIGRVQAREGPRGFFGALCNTGLPD